MYYNYPQPQNNYLQQYMPAQQQSNKLPPQQIVRARGKESVDRIEMYPNSSALILDETAPIVWMCVSDGLGNVTKSPYDVTPHVDEPPVNIDSLEQRLTSLEHTFHKMEERLNESYDAKPYEQSNITGHSTNKTDDEYSN